jgi:hypothetical protein
LALLGLLAFAVGCAHVLEFRMPQEFKDGKLVEDPPATSLPVHADVMPC